MSVRNFVERILAVAGLAFASPVLVVAAVAIVVEDGFPVRFRQLRIGKNGRPFMLWKLRSMRSAPAPRCITAAGDPRVTKVGRWIRRYKIDELLQLWNVARGEMSLIGPRPEVPRYVDLKDPLWERVLSAPPGITDLASLVYRNEEELLSLAECPEAYYRSTVLPDKLALNVNYMQHRSLARDAKLLFLTIRYSFWPSDFDPVAVRDSLSK